MTLEPTYCKVSSILDLWRRGRVLVAYLEAIGQSKIGRCQRSAMRILPHHRSRRKMPDAHVHHQVVADHPLPRRVELPAHIAAQESRRRGLHFRCRTAVVDVVEPRSDLPAFLLEQQGYMFRRRQVQVHPLLFDVLIAEQISQPKRIMVAWILLI